MEPHLARLSTNNDPPSETIIHEVKELLVTPSHELADIDSEIAQLGARLISLTEKRNAIQKSIDQYISILSPVRRVPPDIVHEIFYHCLPIHRNPIMTASEAPMLLTRICSSWRSIALSSPRLWAQLHITFCDNYRVSDPDIVTGPMFDDTYGTEGFRAHAEKTLRRRCDVVKEWLGRSGTCPLSISLYYTSGMWNRAELDSVGHITLELFQNLIIFKQRWREIELSIPLEIYRTFEAMVPVDTLPILSLFRGNFHELIPGSPFGELSPVAFLKAPNLERVSLSGSARLWKLSNIPLAAWSEKLTYLCCHSPLNVADAFRLIKHLHNLEHCKLYIAESTGSLGHDPDDPRLHGLISLPHLQSLCIVEDSTDPAKMTTLYGNIDAPSLRWIDYQKYTHTMIQHEVTDPDFLSPVLSLFRKSSHVKKLTLDTRSMSPWNMRRILRLGTHLTHLVMGQEPLGPFRVLSREANYFPTGVVSGQESFFELLIIRDDNSPSVFDTVSSKEVLLPNLEVLEVSASQSSNISDEQLVQFITSRMGSSHGSAVIKKVRMVFNRVKGVDVAEEVAQFWEAKRSDRKELCTVKLELEYLLSPRPEFPNPLSPSFCLTDDGQSWVYPDIAEAALPRE